MPDYKQLKTVGQTERSILEYILTDVVPDYQDKPDALAALEMVLEWILSSEEDFAANVILNAIYDYNAEIAQKVSDVKLVVPPS